MRYLVFPLLVMAALLLTVGQEVAAAAYAYVMGVCREYLAQRSAGGLALSILSMLALGGAAVGGFTLAKELRRLRHLSLTLAGSVQRPLTLDGVASPPGVLIEDSTLFAFCHGLMAPRVYVSSALAELLTPAELRAVLLHEDVHARRKDPARLLAARVLAAVCFPLPAARQARDRYLARLEVYADRVTVAQVGPRPLTAALLKLLSPALAAQLEAAVAAFNVTEERIRRLTEPGSDHAPITLAPRRTVAATGALVLGVGFATSLSIGAVSAFLANATFCPVQVA